MFKKPVVHMLFTVFLALFAFTGTASAATVSLNDITVRDGTVLKSNVFEPGTPGKHPAIIFINSWGLNQAEYLAQEQHFADKGYTVLSYTTRGFYLSGGQIERPARRTWRTSPT